MSQPELPAPTTSTHDTGGGIHYVKSERHTEYVDYLAYLEQMRRGLLRYSRRGYRVDTGLALDPCGLGNPFTASKSAHRTWQHALQNSVAADEVMIERRADMRQNQ
jgi:hypothetical protein